jgi:O-antigen biosynthesis protein
MKVSRDVYEQSARRRLHQNELPPTVLLRNEFVTNLLDHGDNCLDIGCGPGNLKPTLMRRFKKVTGVDLSLSSIRSASKRGVYAVNADFDESGLPFIDGSFDAVICCDVLEHAFDPNMLLSRIHPVLRSGGQLVVSVPNIRFWPRVFSLINGYFPRTSSDPIGFDGGHLHYFATRNLIELFKNTGYRDIQVYGFNADPSRRAIVVSLGLRTRLFRTLAREFGCSTIIVIARR